MKIDNVEVISIKLKAGNTRFNFPIIENIRGKKIVAIESWLVANVPSDALGQTNCNKTAFDKGFLTLSSNGKEVVKDIPLNSLAVVNNNGVIKELNELVINDQKSYVSFSNATGIVADEVVILALYYKN